MTAPKLVCYGIKNCDTMKKARLWLESHKIAYEFVDYKQPGLVEAHLADWNRRAGWQALLNTRGLMWKKLTEEERADMNQTKAHKVMETYPSIIKRPVLDTGKKLLVGFDPEVYAKTLL